MSERTVIQAIAGTLDALQRCRKYADGTERPIARVADDNGTDITIAHWGDMADRHQRELERVTREYLPSGSGLDASPYVDLDASRADRLVIVAEFHHMSDHGNYSGWTEHTIVVTPSLIHGIDIRVTGRDRNGIKDYLAETFAYALQASIAPVARETSTVSA